MLKATKDKLTKFIINRYKQQPTEAELTEIKTICIERTRKAKKVFSVSDKATALRYYLIGLNLYEISKILDISEKTLEKWKQNENWSKYKVSMPIYETVYKLSNSGYSYTEIGTMINVHPKTVYNYMKKYNNDNS
jgi:DNA-binding CsgD family transcriptional regulator